MRFTTFSFLSLRKTSLQYRAVIQSCVLKIKEKLSKFINILDFFGNFFVFEIMFIFNSQLITIIVTNKINIKSTVWILENVNDGTIAESLQTEVCMSSFSYFS